jgi:uncharacterized membrane protein
MRAVDPTRRTNMESWEEAGQAHEGRSPLRLDPAHREEPTPAVAAIAGHPIHPLLVPMPIGSLVLALASDVAYVATRDRFFLRASRLLGLTGIATGLMAGLAGATDFLGRPRIREHGSAWVHAGGNLLAIALTAVKLSITRDRPDKSTVPAGLALSLLTGTILLVTGWLGGELAYRHEIGVSPVDRQ